MDNTIPFEPGRTIGRTENFEPQFIKLNIEVLEFTEKSKTEDFRNLETTKSLNIIVFQLDYCGKLENRLKLNYIFPPLIGKTVNRFLIWINLLHNQGVTCFPRRSQYGWCSKKIVSVHITSRKTLRGKNFVSFKRLLRSVVSQKLSPHTKNTHKCRFPKFFRVRCDFECVTSLTGEMEGYRTEIVFHQIKFSNGYHTKLDLEDVLASEYQKHFWT